MGAKLSKRLINRLVTEGENRLTLGDLHKVIQTGGLRGKLWKKSALEGRLREDMISLDPE